MSLYYSACDDIHPLSRLNTQSSCLLNTNRLDRIAKRIIVAFKGKGCCAALRMQYRSSFSIVGNAGWQKDQINQTLNSNRKWAQLFLLFFSPISLTKLFKQVFPFFPGGSAAFFFPLNCLPSHRHWDSFNASRHFEQFC